VSAVPGVPGAQRAAEAEAARAAEERNKLAPIRVSIKMNNVQ